MHNIQKEGSKKLQGFHKRQDLEHLNFYLFISNTKRIFFADQRKELIVYGRLTDFHQINEITTDLIMSSNDKF